MLKTLPELRPGDVVKFTIGVMEIHARVIEDRGHLGVGGGQIVRVEVLNDEYEDTPSRFEVPAAEVVLEHAAAK